MKDILTAPFVKEMCFTVELSRQLNNDISGSDALRGHTRSHPEHDG